MARLYNYATEKQAQRYAKVLTKRWPNAEFTVEPSTNWSYPFRYLIRMTGRVVHADGHRDTMFVGRILAVMLILLALLASPAETRSSGGGHHAYGAHSSSHRGHR